MKNIFKFFGTILTVVLTAVSLSGCLAEDDLGSADAGLHIKVFFPTKVVAGQPMTINGSGFTDVKEIIFPGEVVVTDFQIVSNDMIRVDAPSGISAEGGVIVVRTENGEVAESTLPLTLGSTKIIGFSVNAGDEVEGGSQITVNGTDLEFVNKVELLDGEGNPLFVEDKVFNKKATATIIFTLPKKMYDGTYVGKLHTIDGKTFDMPELTYKSAADEGYWITEEVILWENPDPATLGGVSWSGQYRFGLEGTDGNGECVATFPAEVWDIIKNGTFHMTYQAPEETYQIRATTGWWSFDGDGVYDIHNGDERVVDNGDGTFTLTYTLSEEPLKSGIYDLIDDQHLLFTGSGNYVPLKIFVTEEVWVPGGGGSMEIVRTSIWKNDGSVAAASWAGSPYRFAPETNTTGEEVYAVPTDVWEKMKSGPFFVDFAMTGDGWFQIRILDGWWSVGNNDANDITPAYEGLVANEDGTYTIEVDLSGNADLLAVLDAQHLLFAGDGFQILELYFAEEVWVGGGGEPAETVIWENADPAGNGEISWSGQYRFGLEGTDGNNECIATLPADVWDIIKNGTFYMSFQATAAQLRITDGWWSTTWTGNDIMAGDERIIDNGDGTYYIEINLDGDPLKDVIDSQHLLFTGSGYTPLKIYYK